MQQSVVVGICCNQTEFDIDEFGLGCFRAGVDGAQACRRDVDPGLRELTTESSRLPRSQAKRPIVACNVSAPGGEDDEDRCGGEAGKRRRENCDDPRNKSRRADWFPDSGHLV
ncbi:hypothetical protein [Mycobacterium sp.]|uniref:hypothetical protein n=1 Tax=Mycobacterium sp. TaxID=1785 RepID=UPI0025D02B44|nr:hypothetical protein [Mycobacterium sp.]